MTSSAEKRATYADLQAVPADRIAELLGGVLYTQPPFDAVELDLGLLWLPSSG